MRGWLWLAALTLACTSTACWYDLPQVSGDAHVQPDSAAQDAATDAAVPNDAITGQDASSPECGNGVIEEDETCDDGNNTNSDGCDEDCQVQDFTACTGEPSQCRCVVYVDKNVEAQGDGASWLTASTQIQFALDYAATAGDCQVWVAQGVYHIWQGSVTDTVELRSGVALMGGFDGTETDADAADPVAHVTTLDGEADTGSGETVRHVLSAITINTALLDGFLIRNGNAGNSSGGGLWMNGSDLNIARCVFHGNSAGHGGAIANFAGDLYVTDSEFDSNVATGSGGAYHGNLGRSSWFWSTFTDNTAATSGGAIASDAEDQFTIQYSELRTNSSALYGGAVDLNGAVNAQVLDTTFEDNGARDGAGLSASGMVDIDRSWFQNNSAENGGGIAALSDANLTVSNTVLTFNHATGTSLGGGGLSAVASAQVSLYNCTLANNFATSGQGNALYSTTLFFLLANSIIHGTDLQIYDDGGTMIRRYSNVAGVSGGPGNIDEPPLMVNPNQGNFQLQVGSPCIDAADGDYAPATDYNSNPRQDDVDALDTGTGTPPWTDMGAYEYQP